MHCEPPCNLNANYYILVRKQTANFREDFTLEQFKSILPLNIPNVPSWLTVK